MPDTARRLYRSRTNRILGGVCGGLAEYFSVDPVIVRLLWVAFSLIWGAGILFYIIAWIIIPPNPFVSASSTSSAAPPPPNSISRGMDDSQHVVIVIGGIVVLVGLAALLQSFGWLWPFSLYLLPLGLMVLGALVIMIAIMRRK